MSTFQINPTDPTTNTHHYYTTEKGPANPTPIPIPDQPIMESCTPSLTHVLTHTHTLVVGYISAGQGSHCAPRHHLHVPLASGWQHPPSPDLKCPPCLALSLSLCHIKGHLSLARQLICLHDASAKYLLNWPTGTESWQSQHNAPLQHQLQGKWLHSLCDKVC